MDDLEREVMVQLVSRGFPAEYEPVVRIGNQRLIPDFRIDGTYIECTHNQQVNNKAADLRERFRMLRENVMFSRGIVVTYPYLLRRYRHYLPGDIDVTTIDGLPSVLT